MCVLHMVLKVTPSLCIRFQSLIALLRFCCFGIHLLSTTTLHTHMQVFILVKFRTVCTANVLTALYNISCQVALNVVCVVHICTIHSLVLCRVLCEVLWMALNVLISECWWLV